MRSTRSHASISFWSVIGEKTLCNLILAQTLDDDDVVVVALTKTHITKSGKLLS